MGPMVLRKLAVSHLLHHRVRTALTVAAIALAVSLVVSVTSGYASAEAAIYKYLAQYMGSVDVEVYRTNDVGAGVTESLVEQIRQDPDVEKADARYESAAVLTDVNGEGGPRVGVIGVRRPQDTRSDYLRLEAGRWFDTSTGDVAVIDQAVADNLVLDAEDGTQRSLPIGGEFILPAPDKQLRLKVVGIVHKPEMLAPFMQTVYVPLDTIQDFAGKTDAVSRVMVDLRLGADDAAFAARWDPKLRAVDPNLRLRLARETRREMENQLHGIHALSYMGGTVSLLAATFIVFSALSMGVAERQRTLAMLRAVGAQRSQVGWLVVAEGLLLAALGAAVGVPLGWAWVKMLAWWHAELNIFSAGVVLDRGGVLFGTVGTVAAALAASLLPAVSATRVDPLEAMAPLSKPPSRRPPLVSAAFGLLLAAIDPLLLFGPVEPVVRSLGFDRPDEAARLFIFYAHFAIGLPGIMVGFFLLAPLFVWVVERVAGPVVAPMFGLRFAMLRQQLSTGVWRVAGTCAALMVGLSVLVVLQTNGNTLLKGWVLPTTFPDLFIMTSNLNGLTEKQLAMLETTPGLRKGQVMPIAIASPEYGSKFAGIAMAAIMPNATMYIGVDPDQAFTMMGLEFREGNPTDAARLLKQGDHLVITEELRQLKDLHLGDKLRLKTNQGERDFTVAGVIWSPGIDVMVSMFDMGRQFDQRTATSVFGSLDDGRKYFGIKEVYLFAANLEYHVEREQALKNIEKQLGRKGMAAADVRHIKAQIEQGLQKLLLLVSTVAFAAMAVSSLGVTNTIMASIRSRRWQFGVLRSIGVTRGQLLRLVLAEAFLIGLVGCALGLAAGFLMAFDANALSGTVMGYRPPLAVPWPIILIGTGIVMVISIAASLWPALSVAHAEPLSLLQAGRAAA